MKKNLFKIIGGFFLSLSLGLGVFAGVNSAKKGSEVKAAEAEAIKLDFTKKGSSHSSYKDNWDYQNTSNDPKWKINYGANNSAGWEFVKLGSKSADNKLNGTYIGSPKISQAITKISVKVIQNTHKDVVKMGVEGWSLEVYSDSSYSTSVASVDMSSTSIDLTETATYDITPTSGGSWSKDSYYKLVFNLTNTSSTNGVLWIESVTMYYQNSVPTTYSVTYDGNGNTSGSVPTDDTDYDPNGTVTVLGNTGSLAKTGYTFNGWNTKADGTGHSYSAGSTFSITANTTLYADWEYSYEYEHEGTLSDPFSVKDAYFKALETGTTATTDLYYIEAYAPSNVGFDSKYYNYTFDVVDSGCSFKFYRLKDGRQNEESPADFTVNDIEPGDKFVVHSKIINYNGTTPENSGGSVVSITKRELTSIVVSGDMTEKEYTNFSTGYNPAGLVATGSYSFGSDADVTNKVEWVFDPSTPVVGQSEISVVAKIGNVESDPYTITGISTTKSSKYTLVVDGISAIPFKDSLEEEWSSDGEIATSSGVSYLKLASSKNAVSHAVSLDSSKPIKVKANCGTFGTGTFKLGFQVFAEATCTTALTDLQTVVPTNSSNNSYDFNSGNGINLKASSPNTVYFKFYASASGAIRFFGFSIEYSLPPALDSISLSGDYQTEFEVGSTFNHDGLVVTAKYDDTSTKTVTNLATFSGYDLNVEIEEPVNQTVTVSYTDNNVTKTTTYSITVKPVAFTFDSIEVKTAPNKIEYFIGDKFNSAGLKVDAVKSSDSSRVDVTNLVTISPADGATLSETTALTITYSNSNAVKTTSGNDLTNTDVTITVKADTVKTLSWTSRPKVDGTKPQIFANETTLGDVIAASADGIGVFTATWDSGKSETPSFGKGENDVHIGLYDGTGTPAAEATALDANYKFQANDNGKRLIAFYKGTFSNASTVTVTKWRSVIGDQDISKQFDYTSGQLVESSNGFDDAVYGTTSNLYSGASFMQFASSKNPGSLEIKSTVNKITKISVYAAQWDNDEQTFKIGNTTFNSLGTSFTECSVSIAGGTNSITLTASSGSRVKIQKIIVYSVQQNGQIGKTANCLGLESFIDNYMHMSDYDPELHVGEDGLGYCKDATNHYYSDAKAAFNDLNDKQRELFTSNEAYANEWARLSAWADANGDSLDADTTRLMQRGNLISIFDNMGSTSTIVIIVVSIFAISTIAGITLIKRKREN